MSVDSIAIEETGQGLDGLPARVEEFLRCIELEFTIADNSALSHECPIGTSLLAIFIYRSHLQHELFVCELNIRTAYLLELSANRP